MGLMTKDIERQLLTNGRATSKAQQQGLEEPDHKPVVKLFNPVGAGTWLISEADPENPDILFGLCDLGQGCPELGSVSRCELEGIRLRAGLRIERDLYWSANHTIGEYAEIARQAGRIQS